MLMSFDFMKFHLPSRPDDMIEIYEVANNVNSNKSNITDPTVYYRNSLKRNFLHSTPVLLNIVTSITFS